MRVVRRIDDAADRLGLFDYRRWYTWRRIPRHFLYRTTVEYCEWHVDRGTHSSREFHFRATGILASDVWRQDGRFEDRFPGSKIWCSSFIDGLSALKSK